MSVTTKITRNSKRFWFSTPSLFVDMVSGHGVDQDRSRNREKKKSDTLQCGSSRMDVLATSGRSPVYVVFL